MGCIVALMHKDRGISGEGEMNLCLFPDLGDLSPFGLGVKFLFGGRTGKPSRRCPISVYNVKAEGSLSA